VLLESGLTRQHVTVRLKYVTSQPEPEMNGKMLTCTAASQPGFNDASTTAILIVNCTLQPQYLCPCPGKKRPQYSRHNFDKFRHSFVFFVRNHPDTSTYYNIGKVSPTLQYRQVEMTSYLTSSKMPFIDKDGHLTKAF